MRSDLVAGHFFSISIEYSEKHRATQLVLEMPDAYAGDLLELSKDQDDDVIIDLGVKLIKGMTQSVSIEALTAGHRLTMDIADDVAD